MVTLTTCLTASKTAAIILFYIMKTSAPLTFPLQNKTQSKRTNSNKQLDTWSVNADACLFTQAFSAERSYNWNYVGVLKLIHRLISKNYIMPPYNDSASKNVIRLTHPLAV